MKLSSYGTLLNNATPVPTGRDYDAITAAVAQAETVLSPVQQQALLQLQEVQTTQQQVQQLMRDSGMGAPPGGGGGQAQSGGRNSGGG